MPFTVELYPSGHRFEAHSGETILEAALRAGRSPAFGCANGSCGECRARIVAGEVERVRFHDYVIADAEKRAGYALLCSTAPRSDLVVESTEASGVDDIAPQRVRARVARIEHASADHAVVHLKVRRARVLRYLAGQRVTVRFENGPARESWLASCPCDAVNLRFHVRRDSEDAFAAHVFDVVGRGANAAVEGPTGSFVLDDNSPRALLFVAFDTGFAPIESLIEHAINLELEVPIRLVRVVPERGLPYRHNYCRAWADALDDFDYRVVEVTLRCRHVIAHGRSAGSRRCVRAGRGARRHGWRRCLRGRTACTRRRMQGSADRSRDARGTGEDRFARLIRRPRPGGRQVRTSCASRGGRFAGRAGRCTAIARDLTHHGPTPHLAAIFHRFAAADADR